MSRKDKEKALPCGLSDPAPLAYEHLFEVLYENQYDPGETTEA